MYTKEKKGLYLTWWFAFCSESYNIALPAYAFLLLPELLPEQLAKLSDT